MTEPAPTSPPAVPAAPSAPAAKPAVATLSRELADFLVELSITLNKHAIYPSSHPLLDVAVDGVANRIGALFVGERDSLSIGVARRQLIIEGVATDPLNPVLKELAQRLHEHHVGAVKFVRGITRDELGAALEPATVAKAIDEHQREEAYDQVIVGYLLQIGEELKSAEGPEAAGLQRRVSRLVASLKESTLERLLEMGGDKTQRRRFLLDASQGITVEAVIDLVKAASAARGPAGLPSM